MITYYLVVDLEGTCCGDGNMPREETETIEIGAVIVNCMWDTISEFASLIKPVRHPILTDFCKELTYIKQEDVDNAKGFVEVHGIFDDWKNRYEMTSFCSWGSYDRDQLKRDCSYHKIDFGFEKHVDLSRMFTKKTGRRRGHRQAMMLLKMKAAGQRHRGLSDAKNIATMLPYLFEDK